MLTQEKDILAEQHTALPIAHRALAFAPHPDDEVFGCGGTLALLRSQGCLVSVIVVTNGAAGGDNVAGDLARIRADESRKAAGILGLSAPTFWGLPDRGLAYGELLIERVKMAITEADADLVLLPSPTELHPDHQALALAGAEALRRLGGARRALFYEINLPLPSPNLVIDITSVFEQKRAAMACFPSQLEEQPYDRRIEGLNHFRSYFLGPQAVAAEAYVLLDATSIQSGLSPLFEGPLAHRRRLGFAASGEDLPLVSVLIRSMDRPTLNRALDSLALQTWPNVEVVLVNAKGGEHSPVGDHCGWFPLRLINDGGAPLHRSRAANIGLAACRGTYIGFLDDDDTIDPDHLHNLVMALQGTPKPAAAYAGVRGVAIDKKERRVIRTFKEPDVGFSRLLLGNILPIHAVLFPALLLTQGVAVDETLDLYEDWDFWLQIAQRVPFVFVDQVSASYYLGGTSAISPFDLDYRIALQASLCLYGKWQGLVDPEVLQGMGSVFLRAVAERETTIAERETTIADLKQTITGHEASIAGLRQTITEQKDNLTELEGIIQEIFASTSWRLSSFLRKIKNFLAGR